MKIAKTLKRLAADFVESWKWAGHALVEQFTYDASPEAEAARQQERAKRNAERAHEDAAKTRQAQLEMEALALQNYEVNVVPYLKLEAFKVVYRAYSRLGAIQPYDAAQIAARCVRKGGCLLTEVYVPRAELTPVQDETLQLVEKTFQQLLNMDLQAGQVEGVNVGFIDNGVPYLFVDDVMVSGSNYVVTIGVASDMKMIQRYRSRRMPRPTPPPAVPFDDFV